MRRRPFRWGVLVVGVLVVGEGQGGVTYSVGYVVAYLGIWGARGVLNPAGTLSLTRGV